MYIKENFDPDSWKGRIVTRSTVLNGAKKEAENLAENFGRRFYLNSKDALIRDEGLNIDDPSFTRELEKLFKESVKLFLATFEKDVNFRDLDRNLKNK